MLVFGAGLCIWLIYTEREGAQRARIVRGGASVRLVSEAGLERESNSALRSVAALEDKKAA
jgi:hypothetical protein